MSRSVSDPPVTGDIPDRLYRRLAWRLLPVIGICYTIAFIDRANIGFAKLQMGADIGLSAAAYGLGAGIFFLAYCLLEVPSNLLLERLGARMWITRIIITWGLVTILTGFVQSEAQFYIARIALGAAEAGFYPGMVLYLASWFPRPRLTRALSFLVMAGPLASIAVGPLSGWIMSGLDSVAGFAGWQWLFFATGAPAILLGVLFYAVMVDSPRQARWLAEGDRDALETAIAAHRPASPSEPSAGKLRATFRNGRVWLLGFGLGAAYLGVYAVVFWMPTMLQTSGIESILTIGLVSAIPWIASAAVIVSVGYLSDRTNRHAAIASAGLVIAAVGLVISVVASQSLAPVLIGLTVAASGFAAVGLVVWGLAHDHLRGSIAVGASIALINTVGSVGSFLGPYVTGLGQEWTGSVQAPILLIAATTVLIAALLIWRLGPQKSRPEPVAARELLVEPPF
jgi:sugar phosphate permease